MRWSPTAPATGGGDGVNILFIGDVVGKSGRRAVARYLPQLVSGRGVDLVVVNAENSAGGFGLTREVAAELFNLGAAVLTTGNHVWDKREVLEFIDREPKILRPLNFPAVTPGRGFCITEAGGARVAVVNLMGQVFMPPSLDNPFHAVDALLEELHGRAEVVLVDFHAEASSEKQAMGWHLDGRVAAVVGTHTHIPTADERVLPGGAAYITDVGMTGNYDSVIGMDTGKVLKRFLRGLPERMEVASGAATMCGVLIKADPADGRSGGIERVLCGPGFGR